MPIGLIVLIFVWILADVLLYGHVIGTLVELIDALHRDYTASAINKSSTCLLFSHAATTVIAKIVLTELLFILGLVLEVL